MTVAYRQITDPYRRTIVVGDIHGCWDEFKQLMELVGFGEGDALVTVGDFLDRGPGSCEISRFLRNTPNAFSVIGNHERRVAGVIRGTSQPAWSQQQTLALLPREEHSDWADWFEALPAVIETPHAIITHARLDPAKPPTDQDAYHTAAVGGSSVTIELDEDGVPIWFGTMQLDKPVCMGHIGYGRVALVPDRLYALDTGAVCAGELTAVIFPGAQIVSFPVHRNYHDAAHKAWRITQLAHSADPMSWTLSQAIKLLNASPDDQADLTHEIRLLKSIISALDIEGRGREIRAQLETRFGEVPAPGPARGEYFKMVKRAFSASESQTLALRLLRGRPLTFADLVSIFLNMHVGNLSSRLDKVEQEVLLTAT